MTINIPQKTTQSSRKGFTLVELIMVIVILGILGTMGAEFISLSFKGFSDTKARADIYEEGKLALTRMEKELRNAVPNAIKDTTGGGATELQFNGAGQRSRLFFKVYAIGLYLTEKKTATADVLSLKGAKRLHVVTLRELTAEQFAEALVEGIHKNHSDAEMAPLQPRIEEFKNAILAVKTAAKRVARKAAPARKMTASSQITRPSS